MFDECFSCHSSGYIESKHRALKKRQSDTSDMVMHKNMDILPNKVTGPGMIENLLYESQPGFWYSNQTLVFSIPYFKECFLKIELKMPNFSIVKCSRPRTLSKKVEKRQHLYLNKKVSQVTETQINLY